MIRTTARGALTHVTLDADDLRRAPGNSSDLLRALQNLPGLARPPLFSGSLIVRGASPADTAVLVDGTYLPTADHFGGLGSTLSPEVVDYIDFYAGNFSPRYGRATGCVVDVILRDPANEGGHATRRVGLLDADASVEVALSPRVSASIASRFGWLGFMLSPVIAATTPYNLSIGYWDHQSVVSWCPTSRDRVCFSFYGCGDRAALLDESGALGAGPAFHIAHARWTRTFSTTTNLDVAVVAG